MQTIDAMAAGKSGTDDTVGAWMRTGVVTLTPRSTLDAALACMEGQEVRHACVLDDGGHLIGIISTTDVSRTAPRALSGPAYLEYAGTLRTAAVAWVMTRAPFFTSPETPLSSALEFMADHRVGALPVVDEGVLVGMLTERDCP